MWVCLFSSLMGYHGVVYPQVVLATNIAETSLTIDDVVFVVDGGKCKEKVFDAARNIATMRVQVSSSSNDAKHRMDARW